MKPIRAHPNATRRDFLRGSLRAFLLGALAVLAVVVGRKADARPLESRCRERVGCQGCALFEGCVLPSARAARRA